MPTTTERATQLQTLLKSDGIYATLEECETLITADSYLRIHELLENA